MIVKIFGTKGEGKSTIASFLVAQLRDLGVQVDAPVEEVDMEMLRKRIEMMGNGGLQVEMREIPLKSETVPKYYRPESSK